MSAPLWMPLYIADYLADTRRLNAAEHGAYLLLIMEYWQIGSLPEDDRQLSRIACMTEKEWKDARPIVEGFFEEGWKHKRIDAELANASETMSKRSAAGKAGAAVRHGRGRGERIANAEQSHANGSAVAMRSDKQTATQPQPPTQSPEAAAAARPPGDYELILNRCLEAADIVDDPAKYPALADISPILSLLGKGYDLERDILPILKARATGGSRGRSWRYYISAIEEGFQANSRIKPKANGNGLGEHKPLNDAASRRGPAGCSSTWEELAALCRKNAKPDGATLWDAMRWGIPEQIPAEHRHLFVGLVIEGQLVEAKTEAA